MTLPEEVDIVSHDRLTSLSVLDTFFWFYPAYATVTGLMDHLCGAVNGEPRCTSLLRFQSQETTALGMQLGGITSRKFSTTASWHVLLCA